MNGKSSDKEENTDLNTIMTMIIHKIKDDKRELQRLYEEKEARKEAKQLQSGMSMYSFAYYLVIFYKCINMKSFSNLIDTYDTIHDTTTNTIDTYLNNNDDTSTKDNSSSKGTVSSTCGSSCNTSYTIDGSGDDDDDGGGKMPASTSDEPTNVRTPPQLRSVKDDNGNTIIQSTTSSNLQSESGVQLAFQSTAAIHRLLDDSINAFSKPWQGEILFNVCIWKSGMSMDSIRHLPLKQANICTYLNWKEPSCYRIYFSTEDYPPPTSDD